MLKRKALLMVCDSQVLMDMTKKILERDSYSVKCAVGISRAKELLADFKFDGIIVDGELPDSYSVNLLRDFLAPCGMPAIFLSEKAEDELSALTAGACDFIKKPYNMDLLKVRLKIMLKDAAAYGSIEFDSSYAVSFDENSAVNTNGAPSINSSNKDAAANNVLSSDVISPDELPRRELLSKSPVKYVTVGRQLSQAVALAACFALVFIIVMTSPYIAQTLMPHESTDTVIVDDPLPLGGSTSPLPQDFPSPIDFIHLPDVAGMEIMVKDLNVSLPLVNPPDNTCDLMFEIRLSDTGECVFLSDVVSPGSSADNVELNRVLEPGSYAARLIITMLTPDNNVSSKGEEKKYGESEISFTLTI